MVRGAVGQVTALSLLSRNLPFSSAIIPFIFLVKILRAKILPLLEHGKNCHGNSEGSFLNFYLCDGPFLSAQLFGESPRLPILSKLPIFLVDIPRKVFIINFRTKEVLYVLANSRRCTALVLKEVLLEEGASAVLTISEDLPSSDSYNSR
jgi:hypothetical protein